MTSGNVGHPRPDQPTKALPGRRWVPAAFGMAAAMAPIAARACPVCWGESGDPLVKGAAAGVIALGIIVYTLLVGFVGFGVMFWVRARRLAATRRDS